MGSDLKIDGSRIRALRLERRWEREQLAQIAQVSIADLRKMESGGIASLDTIQAVAGSFGLETCELLSEPAGIGLAASISPVKNSSTRSNALQDQVPSFLLPYLPIIKSALAASAFALLAAFAIRLSPLIIEKDPRARLVESFEISQPAYTISVAAIEAELGTKILSDSEDPAANPLYAYKRTAPIAGSARMGLPNGTGNPLTETITSTESVRRPDAAVLPEAQIDYWSTAESAIIFHSADFTSLVSTRDRVAEIPIGLVAPLSQSDSNPLNGDNVFELMAHGTSTGFKSMSRSLVFSGKTTASFFSKVGSSIKKAF
jgi:transcriptional regulator with XRE-family HTH domain